MSVKAYDYAVYFGRFQPVHLGHAACVAEGLRQAERLIIVIGSIDKPRDIKNPWTFDERRDMIEAMLAPQDRQRVIIRGLVDTVYNQTAWLEGAQALVDDVCTEGGPASNSPKVAIVGYKRDRSSEYLEDFPQWHQILIDEVRNISATGIRNQYFGAPFVDDSDLEEEEEANTDFQALASQLADVLEPLPIPPASKHYLVAFAAVSHRHTYLRLVKWLHFARRYRQQFSAFPYPVIHQTVDAVTVQSGHVLLVRRQAQPGKGLWALPGGFLCEFETLEAAIIRELKEETGLDVTTPELRRRMITSQRFANPDRSTRGRTITEAFLIDLGDGELAKVRGGSDAAEARWFPLAEVKRMRDRLFEDHYDILLTLLKMT